MVKLNLTKYLGRWNEVASFPAWFSKKCRNTTATYSTKEGDNFVKVENSCDVDGKRKVAIGKAFLTDKEDTLGVKFFALSPKAPYKVLYIDDEYKNAIIGSGKGYLWFLTKEEQMDDKVYEDFIKIAENNGYNTKRLVKTRDIKK